MLSTWRRPRAKYAKGNLAGHSRAEVRAHINKNAKRLGLPGLDGDGDHGEDDVAATMVGLTQESQAAAMMLSAGQDSASAVIARHPELSFLFKAGRTSDRKHPARSGQPVTTATRAHRSDLDEDPTDTDQPAGRGVHAGVARYLKMHADQWGGEALDAGSHGSESHAPKTPAQRHLEETYGLDGGRPGGRSIEDLSRGAARMHGR